MECVTQTVKPIIAENLLALPRNSKEVVLFSVDAGGPLDKAGLKRAESPQQMSNLIRTKV